MIKVLIADKLSSKSVEIFESFGIDVDVKTGMSEDQLLACVGDYEGLAIRSATKVNAKVMEHAKKLKVIGRAGIGVDNVDLDVATEHGVIVMNTPFGNAITTAEHSIAMLMSLVRKIPKASASVSAGKWEKSKFMGVEVTDKVMGLIGCGNIGTIVADRAQGLRMKVMAYDPFLSESRASALNITKTDLHTLLRKADFVSIHTPLTPDTKNIINRENLAQSKKGIRIINCARGGLVNEDDLYEAIRSGHVAGAALDVFATEPPAPNHKLFELDEVIFTPHLGAATAEAQENVALQVAEQMGKYLTKGSIVNSVNSFSLSIDEAKKLEPYLKLSRDLGSFTAKVFAKDISKIEIDYRGKVSELNSKVITSNIVYSTLNNFIENINQINAVRVAKNRSIDVKETKRSSDHSNYNSVIKVVVKDCENNSLSVEASLFGQETRIIKVNNVSLEASLGQHMIYVVNKDKPGLIGGVGGFLGRNGVNIGNFNLGRDREGKENSIALIEIDRDIDIKLIEEIKMLDSVIDVKLL